MNLLNLQGQLLHLVPPRREGGSAIAVMQVGVPRNTKDYVVQRVNKSLVRILGKWFKNHDINELKVNNYYEMWGALDPLMRRNLLGTDTVLTTSMVISGFKPLKPNGTLKGHQLDNTLYNRWIGTGRLMEYRPAERHPDRRPDVMILKVREEVPDTGRRIQGSDRVAIDVPPHLRERFAGIGINSDLLVECRSTGVLRRVPAANGEYEQTLHNSLFLSRVNVMGIGHIWDTGTSSPAEPLNQEILVPDEEDDADLSDDGDSLVFKGE